jgi:hypothetical protein
VHGSNATNLSVKVSLSQASKNAMSSLLSLMFSLQKNWRRGWDGFCLEVKGVGRRGRQAGDGGVGRDNPNNVYTYE